MIKLHNIACTDRDFAHDFASWRTWDSQEFPTTQEVAFWAASPVFSPWGFRHTFGWARFDAGVGVGAGDRPGAEGASDLSFARADWPNMEAEYPFVSALTLQIFTQHHISRTAESCVS